MQSPTKNISGCRTNTHHGSYHNNDNYLSKSNNNSHHKNHQMSLKDREQLNRVKYQRVNENDCRIPTESRELRSIKTSREKRDYEKWTAPSGFCSPKSTTKNGSFFHQYSSKSYGKDSKINRDALRQSN